ncbi:MAG: peptidylprolyl isomerase [Candidatus Krumholzibacteriota bacterium]|nr:peptidylprolyl isomerase [Candidatus Krumholzibacteriota bacterium]
MSVVRQGDTIRVHYTGRLTDGTVFDSSEGRQPLEFTVGENQVIPGFDAGVVEMSPGDSKEVSIAADQAYGPSRPDLMLEIDRGQIPSEIELKKGLQLEMSQQDGERLIVTVTRFTDKSVTLDANHPLAGKDLVFEIELVEIV